MRLVLALLLALEPLASAQRVVVETRVPGQAAGRVLSVPLSLPSALPLAPAFSLAAPELTGIPVVSQPAVAQAPQAEGAASVAELAAAAETVAAQSESLSKLPAESSRATVDGQFALLTGERRASLPDDSFVAAALQSLDQPILSKPSADAARRGSKEPPAPKGDILKTLFGSSAFKIGTATLNVAMMAWGITLFSGAAWVVPAMALSNAGGQMISALFAGRLAARFSPNRVIAAVVSAQAIVVLATVLSGGAAWFAPSLVFPIFGLLGVGTGIAEPSRKAIAPLLVGTDDKALDSYNGKQHMFYEVAGVLASAGIAFAIKLLWKDFGMGQELGTRLALLILPPAYLAAAWLYWTAKMTYPHVPDSAKPQPPGPKGSIWKRLMASARALAHEINETRKTVFADARVRWIAAAVVLGAMGHRVAESVLASSYANTVLHDASKLGYILSLSDLGELIGAFLLVKLAGIIGDRWLVAAAAVGTLALCAMPGGLSLAWVLPGIAFASLTWAMSDQSLATSLQSTLPQKKLARALSLINVLTVAAVTGGTILLGLLLKAAAAGPAALVIGGGLAVVAVLMLVAARRLKP